MLQKYHAVAHQHQGISLRGHLGGYVEFSFTQGYQASPIYQALASGKISGPPGTAYWLIVDHKETFVESLPVPVKTQPAG